MPAYFSRNNLKNVYPNRLSIVFVYFAQKVLKKMSLVVKMITFVVFV